jgi:hypothetical protein
MPVATESVPVVARSCLSCGVAIPDRYCSRCGELAVDQRELRARVVVSRLVREVVDADSRLLRTLRALLTRPGLLTLEYLVGARSAYLSPLALYLLVFGTLLAWTAVLPPLDGGKDLVHWMVSVPPISTSIERIAAAREVDAAAALELVMRRVEGMQAWLKLLVPGIFAASMGIVLGGRRRFLGEHLVFALHYATFNYTMGLLVPLFERTPPWSALAFYVVLLVWQITYLAIAVRRVYGTSRLTGAALSLPLVVAFMVAQFGTVFLGYVVAGFLLLR